MGKVYEIVIMKIMNEWIVELNSFSDFKNSLADNPNSEKLKVVKTIYNSGTINLLCRFGNSGSIFGEIRNNWIG